MLHIALCDDNPASIEILEKYFDILNDSTIDYDVYFSAEELYRYKLNNELTYDIYILDIEMLVLCQEKVQIKYNQFSLFM